MDRSPLRVHHSLNRHRLATFDYRDANHAYFVTICAQQGSPFTDHRLAQEVIDSLHWLRLHRDIAVYAYCLMPDHLHLLLQPHNANHYLGSIIGAMKSWTTRRSWALGYAGNLWQPRFHDHIVRRSESGERIARYILENPVRKGLVTDAQSYPWSGMPDPLGDR